MSSWPSLENRLEVIRKEVYEGPSEVIVQLPKGLVKHIYSSDSSEPGVFETTILGEAEAEALVPKPPDELLPKHLLDRLLEGCQVEDREALRFYQPQRAAKEKLSRHVGALITSDAADFATFLNREGSIPQRRIFTRRPPLEEYVRGRPKASAAAIKCWGIYTSSSTLGTSRTWKESTVRGPDVKVFSGLALSGTGKLYSYQHDQVTGEANMGISNFNVLDPEFTDLKLHVLEWHQKFISLAVRELDL